MVRMQKNSSITTYLPLWAAAVFALMMMLPPAVLAEVQLRVDRNEVTVGETVTLVFLTDDPKQNLEADLSVLGEHFDILDRRSETQLSIVNGRQTAIVRQLVTVEPKVAGTLTIPSFDFDGYRTAPVSLKVNPAPELAAGELPPVFLEVELTPGEGPYFVHAQFGLVVRVFYQQNLTEAGIGQPNPAPASVRLLQETPYQAERGGKRFRVLERHYAIFPERSGELLIPPIELSGRLVERRSGGVWQQNQKGRRVRASSDQLTLNIEPRPAGFSGAWQPARELTLAQQISSGDALRVGEPVTRTVLLDAVGLEENMLVEPQWPELRGARIYPDQPQGITRDDGRWVLGHKEFRYAVVPEEEGELVLPELTVDWWDTKNNVQKTAVLPAHTLQVQPSALVTQVPVTPAPTAAREVSAESVGLAGDTPSGPWRTLTLVFAALWAATLFLTWRLWARNGNGNGSDSGVVISSDEKALLERLKRACYSDDRGEARRAMHKWLRHHGPVNSGSLLEFAEYLDDEALQQGLYALDSDGYRRDGGASWSGHSFFRQFEVWRKRMNGRENSEQAPLTDLYARANR